MIIRNKIGRTAARVAIFVMTWAVLFLVFDRLLMPLYTRKFNETPVPNLVGSPLYVATAAAERYGFEVVRERARPDGKQLPETVVEQRPAFGTNAKPGRTIFVTVAARDAQVPMLSLFELSPREATLKLEDLGLDLAGGDPEFEYSDLVAPGFITRQEPSAGTMVRPSTIVKIMLSKGPEPGKTIIPDLTGLTLDHAKKALKQSNATMLDASFERNLNIPEGHVIRQNPPPGTVVENNTGVELIISSGK